MVLFLVGLMLTGISIVIKSEVLSRCTLKNVDTLGRKTLGSVDWMKEKIRPKEPIKQKPKTPKKELLVLE